VTRGRACSDLLRNSFSLCNSSRRSATCVAEERRALFSSAGLSPLARTSACYASEQGHARTTVDFSLGRVSAAQIAQSPRRCALAMRRPLPAVARVCRVAVRGRARVLLAVSPERLGWCGPPGSCAHRPVLLCVFLTFLSPLSSLSLSLSLSRSLSLALLRPLLSHAARGQSRRVRPRGHDVQARLRRTQTCGGAPALLHSSSPGCAARGWPQHVSSDRARGVPAGALQQTRRPPVWRDRRCTHKAPRTFPPCAMTADLCSASYVVPQGCACAALMRTDLLRASAFAPLAVAPGPTLARQAAGARLHGSACCAPRAARRVTSAG
jgi:hypothetical protein